MALRDLLVRSGDAADCQCAATVDDDCLVLDAEGCDGDGLAAAPACRSTAVRALDGRAVERVLRRDRGTECRYAGRSVALLVAAGRFRARVAHRDAPLVADPARDPLAAAREAAGRAGPVADAAAATGLLEVADGMDYDSGFRPLVGPTVARASVTLDPPDGGRLVGTATLDTGATVRQYDVPDALPVYHLEPVEHTLSRTARRALADARERLAAGAVEGGPRGPERAVRAVVDGGAPADVLGSVLRKHTRGYGVLEDFFADERVSDVYASAPADACHLRVRAGGETMRTNVRLTDDGAAALASRLRRSSGRAFSRADPTLDAVAEDVGAADRVRAAGVTDPVSDGTGFAFRAHGETPFTLPALVANDTMTAEVAGLLSLAVERAGAGLVAGTRGAGKTTLLGALLWELRPATRLVVIEDTPELPVSALQSHDRDVQALRVGDGRGTLDAPAALRTALRLGEGALVVGEVRGEEAAVLYEAMRVGASGSAVLGTIHGDGAPAVRERVVSDLGVEASAFGATDFVVTLGLHETADGVERRVETVEEVVPSEGEPGFALLYERRDGLSPTGRIDRGNSHLLESLTRPEETYDEVRKAHADRTERVDALVAEGRTDAADVAEASASRGP